MATVNFNVPDDVKQAFNLAFAGKNKSAVIATLMREAVERAQRQRRSEAAMERIIAQHADAPRCSAKELRAARVRGRP